jgi:hypothetical protein
VPDATLEYRGNPIAPQHTRRDPRHPQIISCQTSRNGWHDSHTLHLSLNR